MIHCLSGIALHLEWYFTIQILRFDRTQIVAVPAGVRARHADRAPAHQRLGTIAYTD
jgi:hypothetical protein